MVNKVFVIGIAGGSASGKTSIVKKIEEKVGAQITVLSHDSYYKAHHNLEFEKRCRLNYDSPDAFDTDLMIEHIIRLKNGETVNIPVYDYRIHDRSDDTVEISPKSVLLIEGILVLANERLRSLMDMKVFVDTAADERILRRISRDNVERGRSLESVMTQYRTTVKPMHDKYVEPSKYTADIIIPHGGRNHVGTDILIQYIEQLLVKSGE